METSLPDDHNWLPLFPLNTVLFPDGVLPLRVFEARYIDMVRDCMKQERPFGIVLIKSGKETGAAAEPEEFGCLAHIAQWDMQDLGVLLLNVQGGQRFRILETHELADHRLEARIQMMAADLAVPISDVHVRCAKALKIVMNDVAAKRQSMPEKRFDSPFDLPIQLDNAGWVANRWCEILPIPLKARQALFALDDPQNRLEIVYQYLERHHII